MGTAMNGGQKQKQSTAAIDQQKGKENMGRIQQQSQQRREKDSGKQMAARRTRVVSTAAHAQTGFTMATAYDTAEYGFGIATQQQNEYEGCD